MKEILQRPRPEPAKDRGELAVLCRLLRAYARSEQEPFAREAGISPVTLWRYERGKSLPSRAALRRLSAAAGLPFESVERLLLPAVRALLAARAGDDGSEEAAGRTVEAGTRVLDVMESLLLGDWSVTLAALDEPDEEDPWDLAADAPPRAADRAAAAYLAGCLLPHSAEERGFLLAECEELSRWVLVEHLADRAVAAATLPGDAGDPPTARGLAELALQVAERVPGEPAWRSRLAAYARASLACVLEASGDREGAASVAAAAWAGWSEGADEAALLDEERFRGAMGGKPTGASGA